MNKREMQDRLWGEGGIGGFLGPVVAGRRRKVRAPEAQELLEARSMITHNLPNGRGFMNR